MAIIGLYGSLFLTYKVISSFGKKEEPKAVIATASTHSKLNRARRLGADEVINYSTEDLKQRVKELTGGKGADVVYDPVGGGGRVLDGAGRGTSASGTCDSSRPQPPQWSCTYSS